MTAAAPNLPGAAKLFSNFFQKGLDNILTLVYTINQKGGDTVKKKKRKPAKQRIDVRTIIISAIVDFLVGLALLLIDKRL